MHTALVSRLLKDRSAWELAHVPMKAEAEQETAAEENVQLGAPILMSA
jgi:hypothetical protein